MTLQAIIVDDEFNARNNLKIMLEDYCPEVHILGMASSAEEAREMIEDLQPQVVFLDIKMPSEDGFSLLQSLPERNFSVVFTTAHNEFALQALKESAVDYIEKPINIDELENAVAKLVRLHKSNELGAHQESIQQIIDKALVQHAADKISIPTKDGFAVVHSEEIIHLEACEGYTRIYLENGQKYLSSKNIKKFEEHLSPNVFFRIHKSHIINIQKHLIEFSRSEGNMAIMSDGSKIPVSRRKLQEFLSLVNTF